jgi:hypothetical protein
LSEGWNPWILLWLGRLQQDKRQRKSLVRFVMISSLREFARSMKRKIKLRLPQSLLVLRMVRSLRCLRKEPLKMVKLGSKLKMN